MILNQGQCFKFDIFNSIYIISRIDNNYENYTIYYKIYSIKNIFKNEWEIIYNLKSNFVNDILTKYEWEILIANNDCEYLGEINKDIGFNINGNLTTNKKNFKLYWRP